MRRLGAGLIGAAAALAVAAPAPAAAPRVHQLVVFRDGSAKQTTVRAKQVTVRVGHKRCAVGAGTPLAALVRSHVGPLSLKDFGSCSNRPADAGQLFVRAIRHDRNRGVDGWVYKVGAKAATAGAADPAGPFGHGRLRGRSIFITWFYCHMNTSTHSCQPNLAVSTQPVAGGLKATVRACDDNAKCAPAAGATVHAGSETATTGADGTATFALPPGHVALFAEKPGAVRSFKEVLDVQ